MSDLISREDAIDALVEKGQSSKRYKLGEFWELNLPEIIDAIDALPSAEPERKTFHVIDKRTGEEADTWEIALNEKWAKSLCYCDMEGFAILEDGTLILTDECGRFEYIQEEDRFEIIWDEVNDED